MIINNEEAKMMVEKNVDTILFMSKKEVVSKITIQKLIDSLNDDNLMKRSVSLKEKMESETMQLRVDMLKQALSQEV